MATRLFQPAAAWMQFALLVVLLALILLVIILMFIPGFSVTDLPTAA